MKLDERSLPLSTDSAEAAALFDRAVEHYLKYHIDTMSLVGQALAADPEFVMAHCLKGYLLLAPPTLPIDSRSPRHSRLPKPTAPPITQREQRHVAAFAAWSSGELDRSFAIWRQILDATPTDLLAWRICDTTWFRHGQTRKILEQADRIAPRWSSDLPGYDCCQCIWAFAHEETGDYAAAERAVDDRTRARPDQLLRASCQGACDGDGLPSTRGTRLAREPDPNWSAGNNLIHHLWWHRTLMELDLGERDAVLASYDENIRNFADPMTKAVPDHYVDLQNAHRVAVAAGTARYRCRRPLAGAGRQGRGAHRRRRTPAAGAAPHACPGSDRTRRGSRRASSQHCARSPPTLRSGPRRPSPMWSFRSARRRWRTGAATTRASSVCWRRASSRSACWAAAPRNATSCSRC